VILLYFSLIFYFGACWGSFLMATYFRRQRHLSIVTPRSYCDFCQTPLPTYCLFPIFSYALSHGRCVFCGTSIPSTSYLTEILSGLLWLFIMQCISPSLLLIVSFLILSFLATEDFALRQIDTRILIFPALILTNWDFNFTRFGLLILLLILILNNFEKQSCFQWIGQGDIEVIIFLALLWGIPLTSWIVLLASMIALVTMLLTKLKTLPFIPYLLIGFIFSMILNP
jgi:leader peptidase (prepilin peptidase)/N-methyltransferase